MAVCQNLVPLVNIKIAGKWMFIPLKMVLIGIDPYPYMYTYTHTINYRYRKLLTNNTPGQSPSQASLRRCSRST